MNETNMFANQTHTPKKIANIEFHPGLTKIIRDEFEYNVPDGTF